ncbi:MAG TPA: hypothetical protein VHJ39_07605 [Solirubrobacteraceae bacterium]|jgi:hypothetical protein|nr:hypothetical protein [Solirubrobacteraceae bacterium]
MIHAMFRGVVGAMAMTGVRVLAAHAGLVREDPPSRLARKGTRGLLRKVPRRRRQTVVELIHWAVGAQGGAVYGMLPEEIRRRPWSGPVYGVLIWVGVDTVIGPLLGLERNWPKGRERAVFIADHVLYGLVLSELRARPRE